MAEAQRLHRPRFTKRKVQQLKQLSAFLHTLKDQQWRDTPFELLGYFTRAETALRKRKQQDITEALEWIDALVASAVVNDEKADEIEPEPQPPQEETPCSHSPPESMS